MSYFYFVKDSDKNQSNLIAIVENQTDQKYFDSDISNDIVEVTNEDFIKVKTSSYEITSYDGSSFSYYHHEASQNPDPNSSNAEFVSNYINTIIARIDKWLSDFPTHDKANDWTAYKNFLNNFDPNSITYPLESSLEQYFQDNSISYKSLLELPAK